MKPTSGNFDSLARYYQALEYLAFGRDLERTRNCLLPHLQNRRRILLVGDGVGRCLERLVGLAPAASIDSIDLSANMLNQARRRMPPAAANIRFIQADIMTCELPLHHYDAVITCFVLDCFDAAQTKAVVARIASSLQNGARWLWADFALPDHGPARWRAQVWLTLLYTSFHWLTGLRAGSLPPSEALIEAAGFKPVARTTRQWGLLRSCIYESTAT